MRRIGRGHRADQLVLAPRQVQVRTVDALALDLLRGAHHDDDGVAGPGELDRGGQLHLVVAPGRVGGQDGGDSAAGVEPPPGDELHVPARGHREPGAPVRRGQVHGGGVVGVALHLLVDQDAAVRLQEDVAPSGDGQVPEAVRLRAQERADLDGGGGVDPRRLQDAAGQPVLGVDLHAGGVQQPDQDAGLAGQRVAGVARAQRGGPVVEMHAGGVDHLRRAGQRVADAVEGGHHGDGIHARAAAALDPGGGGVRPEHGDPAQARGVQGEQRVLVAQEYGARGDGPAQQRAGGGVVSPFGMGKVVVSRLRAGSVVISPSGVGKVVASPLQKGRAMVFPPREDGEGGGPVRREARIPGIPGIPGMQRADPEGQPEQAPDLVVDRGLRNVARAHRGDQRLPPGALGARHREVLRGTGRGTGGADASPVRHDHSVEAPRRLERVGEQGVLRHRGPVHPVVGRHDGPDARLHRGLERRQVQLAQGPLVDAGVEGEPFGLGVVGDVVLGGGRHPARLDAADAGGADPAGQQGILGVALEMAAAER